jgi:NAD(P)-dependent dehydrogenase (short-subunit alcohol dehydrogenase family)
VRRGAKVYLAARSEEKAEDAIVRMEQEGMGEHPGELVWLPIDLTDPRRAKAAAEWFIKRESRLDILGTSSKMLCVLDGWLIILFSLLLWLSPCLLHSE